MKQQKAPKRDVDAIWRSLNGSDSNANKQSLERLWHGFNSDISKPGRITLGAHQDSTSKKAQQLQLDPLLCTFATASAPRTLQHTTTTAENCLEGAAVDRLVQSLHSADASIRRAALQQVHARYVEAQPAPTPESVAEALSCKLGKALLRRFEDKAESCRELAVSSFTQMLQVGQDATLGLLPYAMPVLEERLHAEQSCGPTEPSEEIRLLLLQLLGLIMDLAGPAIAAYASEVWSMLSAGLADSYHNVLVQGCCVAQQLAAILGMRLGQISKDIVTALLPLTTHKRHRVRIAAIQALRDVMHMGAHETILEMVGWRDPNMVPLKAFYGDDLKVNFCGKLATDHHVQVRLAFLNMIGNWLLTLRERTDHQPRLLPYLLSGLCDDSPAVVQVALGLLEQLGEQYEQEHEKELTDLVRFGLQAQNDTEARFTQALQTHSVKYSGSRPASSESAADKAEAAALVTASGSSSEDAAFKLPCPFAERPRLGSRLLACNNFSASLHALCAELSSWQSGPRAMSAQLLRVNLVLAESTAERHLQVLLPALCAAIRDQDAGPVVADCAAVLGCHCDFGMILTLLIPRALDDTGDSKRQADVLLVLAAVLRGAGPVGRLAGHSQRLLDLLGQPDIAKSQDSNIKAAVSAVMQQLLACGMCAPGSCADAAGSDKAEVGAAAATSLCRNSADSMKEDVPSLDLL